MPGEPLIGRLKAARSSSSRSLRLGRLLKSLAILTIQACSLPALSCLLTAFLIVLNPYSNVSRFLALGDDSR